MSANGRKRPVKFRISMTSEWPLWMKADIIRVIATQRKRPSFEGLFRMVAPRPGLESETN